MHVRSLPPLPRVVMAFVLLPLPRKPVKTATGASLGAGESAALRAGRLAS